MSTGRNLPSKQVVGSKSTGKNLLFFLLHVSSISLDDTLVGLRAAAAAMTVCGMSVVQQTSYREKIVKTIKLVEGTGARSKKLQELRLTGRVFELLSQQTALELCHSTDISVRDENEYISYLCDVITVEPR